MKKKYLFLSLIAAMVMALGVRAQEDTYNMIIKMADGTTVYIKPNEVDSISFSNGAVSVSGSTINDIIGKIDKKIQEIVETEQQRTDLQIDELRTVIGKLDLKYSKGIPADAKILDPETDEPLNWYSPWSDGDWTLYRMLRDITSNALLSEELLRSLSGLNCSIDDIGIYLQEYLDMFRDSITNLESHVQDLNNRIKRLEAEVYK